MKTAHQFAKELLDGPDLPIAVMSLFEDYANEPAVDKTSMLSSSGYTEDVLLISAAISVATHKSK